MTEHNELSLLSIGENQVTWNADQKKAIIDNLGLTHATDADMAVFFHMCRRTQLDPFRKQIYMISRLTWDPETKTKRPRQTFQTGIDGYRVIAERVAVKQGVKLKKARFEYWDSEGTKTDIWFKEEPPALIRATVQLGEEEPAIWDARFSEYVPWIEETEWQEVNGKNKKVGTGKMVRQGMWATRPTAQLEKCAEAGALRRACPEDLSNLYVDAEIQRGDRDEPERVPAGKGAVIDASGRDWLDEVARANGVDGERDVLRAIWRDAAAAGELNATIQVAINSRGAEISAAKNTPPQTDAPDEVPNPGPDPEPAAGTPIDADDGHDVVQPEADPAPMTVHGDCKGCGATDVALGEGDLCETCQADPDFASVPEK